MLDTLHTRIEYALSWCKAQGIAIPPKVLAMAHACGFKTVGYFTGTLHGLIADLYQRHITQDQFEQMGQQLIDDQVREAWYEGLGANGLDIENMTAEWMAHLDGIISREQDHFHGFANDIFSAAMEDSGIEALFARADLYAQRWIDIQNEAILYTAAALDTYVWVLGNTEQHCPECAAMDGWVATAEEWQASGILPQHPPNDYLTCGGWRCDCRMEHTDAPSMGEPVL